MGDLENEVEDQENQEDKMYRDPESIYRDDVINVLNFDVDQVLKPLSVQEYITK